MLREEPLNMIICIIVYLFALAYGLYFISSAAALGIISYGFFIVMFIILLPTLFFAVYFSRSSIEILYGKERILRILCYVTSVAASIFIALTIVPMTW